jgi:prepilin-type N-terminal cleavage/methylation domain-containing protein
MHGKRDVALLPRRDGLSPKEWHVKRAKGFTLIELCVVMGIIAILAVTAMMYSKHWVSEYRLSNFARATEGSIRMARMQAITQGRDCALIISTQDIVSSTQLLSNTANFKGNYATLGPYLVTNTDSYKPYQTYFALDSDNTNTQTRVYYLLYNSSLYSIRDVTTDPATGSALTLGTWDSPDATNFNVKFNSHGFPWIYQGNSPRPYQARSLLLQSLTLKNPTESRGIPGFRGIEVRITPNGKISEWEQGKQN